MALGTDYIIRYLADIKGAVAGAKTLENINAQTAKNIQDQYGRATKIIGNIQPSIKISPITSGQFAGLNKEIITTGQVVQTTNGSFLELSKTQVLVNGQLQSTAGGVKDVTNQFVKGNLEAAKGNKVFSNFADNIKQLAGRAILTIPIWIALRSAIMGTFSAISSSFQALETLSLALQKAKQNLQGTTEQISANFEQLKKDSRSLALETGISQNKIIEAFQKFATVGFDYETSMGGANAATKLAIILQGDAGETANAFARSMRVLIDTSKGAKTESEQIADAASLTLELWRSNAFEIGEMTQSLEKFSGTAKTMNFTTSQTIALLATLSTAGLRGSQAGTLLKTSVGKLIEQLDVLAGSVGVKFNKNLDSAFDVLIRVIDQIKILSETSKLAPEATEAIADIFGGVRGAQPIRALIALREELEKNINLVPDLNKFNASFKDTESVLGHVIARYHVANQEIGKGFITGITGEEDFVKGLEKIIELLDKIAINAKEFGKTIHEAFNINNLPIIKVAKIPFELVSNNAQANEQINTQINEALKGTMAKVDLSKLLDTLLKAQTLNLDIGIGEQALNTAINAIKSKLLAPSTKVSKELEKQANIENNINNILIKREDINRLEGFVKKELSTLGLDELDIEKRLLLVKEASNRFSDNDIRLQKELISHLERIQELEIRRETATGLIDNQLELLRLQGATTLQLVQERIELEKMYGINQTRADLLKNELELNKEITKEKENQNKVSSDSLKLFQISQKYGIQTATKASDFLSGKIPVRSLESYGANSSLLPILKEFFASELEQRKAQEFFFSGQGVNIPIPERRAIQEFQPQPLSSINLPSIQTDVGGVKVEIKKVFSEKDVSKQIIDALLDAIRSNPTIQEAIDEKIDNF